MKLFRDDGKSKFVLLIVISLWCMNFVRTAGASQGEFYKMNGSWPVRFGFFLSLKEDGRQLVFEEINPVTKESMGEMDQKDILLISLSEAVTGKWAEKTECPLDIVFFPLVVDKYKTRFISQFFETPGVAKALDALIKNRIGVYLYTYGSDTPISLKNSDMLKKLFSGTKPPILFDEAANKKFMDLLFTNNADPADKRKKVYIVLWDQKTEPFKVEISFQKDRIALFNMSADTSYMGSKSSDKMHNFCRLNDIRYRRIPYCKPESNGADCSQEYNAFFSEYLETDLKQQLGGLFYLELISRFGGWQDHRYFRVSSPGSPIVVELSASIETHPHYVKWNKEQSQTLAYLKKNLSENDTASAYENLEKLVDRYRSVGQSLIHKYWKDKASEAVARGDIAKAVEIKRKAGKDNVEEIEHLIVHHIQNEIRSETEVDPFNAMRVLKSYQKNHLISPSQGQALKNGIFTALMDSVSIPLQQGHFSASYKQLKRCRKELLNENSWLLQLEDRFNSALKKSEYGKALTALKKKKFDSAASSISKLQNSGEFPEAMLSDLIGTYNKAYGQAKKNTIQSKIKAKDFREAEAIIKELKSLQIVPEKEIYQLSSELYYEEARYLCGSGKMEQGIAAMKLWEKESEKIGQKGKDRQRKGALAFLILKETINKGASDADTIVPEYAYRLYRSNDSALLKAVLPYIANWVSEDTLPEKLTRRCAALAGLNLCYKALKESESKQAATALNTLAFSGGDISAALTEAEEQYIHAPEDQLFKAFENYVGLSRLDGFFPLLKTMAEAAIAHHLTRGQAASIVKSVVENPVTDGWNQYLKVFNVSGVDLLDPEFVQKRMAMGERIFIVRHSQKADDGSNLPIYRVYLGFNSGKFILFTIAAQVTPDQFSMYKKLNQMDKIRANHFRHYALKDYHGADTFACLVVSQMLTSVPEVDPKKTVKTLFRLFFKQDNILSYAMMLGHPPEYPPLVLQPEGIEAEIVGHEKFNESILAFTMETKTEKALTEIGAPYFSQVVDGDGKKEMQKKGIIRIGMNN